MRLHKKTTLIFFPLVLSVLGATWTHVVQNEEHVDGYVYRTGGRTPIPEVTVRVYYANGKSRDRNTDTNGYYKVEFPSQEMPIRVKYLPLKEQIFFSELKGLSGSRPHTISRTEESGYSASRAAQLYDSAREARAEMDSMPAAERSATEQYYRGLLTDVRIEQNTVTDESTRQFLQLKQNEARGQYGLALEPLKNETGALMPAVLRKPFVGPGTPLSLPDDNTGEDFRILLKRFCSPTPVSPANKTGPRIYRCTEPIPQTPGPSPLKPDRPNLNSSPGNANQFSPRLR